MTISVIRTVILYLLLMISMRLMGKRQLGELQPSELVVTLLLSDLAAVPMQENGLPLLNGILPILVLVSLELLLSGAMLKWAPLSKLVAGSPVTIVQNGMVDAAALKRLRMTVEDLDESLRRFSSVFPACGSDNSAVELSCDELERAAQGFAGWVDVCRLA